VANDNFLDELSGVNTVPQANASDNFLDQMAGINSQTKTQGQDIVSRIGTDLKERAKTFMEPGYIQGNFEHPWSIAQNTLRTGGQIAGAGMDIIGQGLRSAYNELTPRQAKEDIEGTVKDIASIPLIADAARYWGDKYNEFKKENPETTKNVEAGANILAITPAGKIIPKGLRGVKGITKESGAIMEDTANLFDRVVRPATEDAIDNQIKQTVKENLNKSIKASSKGKSTLPLIEKYFEDAGTGIKEIIKNKNGLNITNDVGEVVNGALPETRLQMAEAIHNTEKKLFQEYDEMQKIAGKKGAVLDLEPVAKQYDDVINNETLRATKEGRAVIKHAEEAQAILREVGTMSPQAAQDFIAQANHKLLNKNLMPVDVSKAAADAGIASIMRKELDALIEKTAGAGYQNIKNRFGAVKSLREGTDKAAFASFAEKGMPNFFDITSGTALVHGLLSLNPATIAGSGFMEILNAARRKLMNPDHYVKKMFSDVDSLMTRKAEFNPVSKTGQFIQSKMNGGSSDFVFPESTPPKPQWDVPRSSTKMIGDVPDYIDAEFKTIPRLDIPRRDAILALPEGQTFTTQGKVVKGAKGEPYRMVGGESVSLKGLRNYQQALKKIDRP
jgi:hypothetical protein